jgi:hypothetical protein
MRLILIVCSILFSINAIAEYRVYHYTVKSKFNEPFDTKTYTVTSTLDPVSYLAFHGGNQSINVDLLRTWMCKGYTGAHQETCSSPLAQMNKGAKL